MDLERLQQGLANDTTVIAAWLFGSRARGDASRHSDVDVAVLRTGGRARTLDDLPLDLADSLSRAVRLPVDVVDLRGAPVDLIHRVFRDGQLLIDRDPRARTRFEVDARNRYFDMLPILREYRSVP